MFTRNDANFLYIQVDCILLKYIKENQIARFLFKFKILIIKKSLHITPPIKTTEPSTCFLEKLKQKQKKEFGSSRLSDDIYIDNYL